MSGQDSTTNGKKKPPSKLNTSAQFEKSFRFFENLAEGHEHAERSFVTHDDMDGGSFKYKGKKNVSPELKGDDSSAKYEKFVGSHEEFAKKEEKDERSDVSHDITPTEPMTKQHDVRPKKFIGKPPVPEKPKHYKCQLKSEERTKIGQKEEVDDDESKQFAKDTLSIVEKREVQKEMDTFELDDLDDKDIDIDETSKLFLKNMLLSNVETCEIAISENEDISLSTSDKDCSNDKRGRFQPNFAEFPSHKTLRKENKRYQEWKKKHPFGQPVYDGYPLPDDAHKKDIFTKEKFASIDQHALQTPQDYLDKTVPEVVSYLTEVCSTDLEKARVIFRWCCAQKLANLKGTGLPDTVKEKLINIKENRGSYTRLYESMCKNAGIQCEVIKGIAKAAGYTVGQKLSDSSGCKSWVAVKIDGLWRLVDLHFAARHQTGGCHGEWELIDDNGKGYREVDDAPIGLAYILNEFYFLTDPEEFIYDHFPNEEHWQLLVRPVTKLEFENMAYLWGSFFTMGMDVLQFKRGIIHAPSGDTVMKFGLPKDDWRCFMYRLWKSSQDTNMDSDLKGNKLTQYVYLEQMDGVVMCKVMYPVTGKYKFELFVGKSGEIYSMSAEYLLLCTKIKELCPALPMNDRQEWGPGHKLRKLGIEPVNCEYGSIETNDGEAELLFTQDPKRPVDILISLSSQSIDESELEEWMLFSTENGKVAIYLKLQDKGHYALDIYAKHKMVKGKRELVCTYLIVSTSGVSDQLKFPILANQKAGSIGEMCTVVPVSHPEPYFTSKEGSETIQFLYDSPSTFSASLFLHKGNDGEEIENHIYFEQEENNITFIVRFPKSGMFKMSIYAKEQGTSGSLPCVYKYVVHVVLPMQKCKPFPEYYLKWGLGCKLRGLTDGELCEDEQIDISVVVPKASDVAVIKTGGNWTHLKRTDQKEWTGKVNTGMAGKEIKLAAKLGSSSYDTLAKCRVFTAQEIRAKEEKLHKEHQSEKKKLLQKGMDQKQKENNFREVERELHGAMRSQNLRRLHETVEKVEAKSYISQLKPKYDAARNSIKSLERISKLKHAIVKLEPTSITNIQRRSTDSKLLAEIMKATLMLLDSKSDLWQEPDIKELSGDKLKENIVKFGLGDLNPEAAAGSLELLKSYRFEDVKEINYTAACLYAWCVGMIEELKVLQNTDVKGNKAICK